jgi:hypothetical protein
MQSGRTGQRTPKSLQKIQKQAQRCRIQYSLTGNRKVIPLPRQGEKNILTDTLLWAFVHIISAASVGNCRLTVNKKSCELKKLPDQFTDILMNERDTCALISIKPDI